MNKRITFEPISRERTDDKAAELGFQKDNRRFKPGNRVEVLDIMSKNRIENEFHKYSVATIQSGTVLEENPCNGKLWYTYRVQMDSGWVWCNQFLNECERLLNEEFAKCQTVIEYALDYKCP